MRDISDGRGAIDRLAAGLLTPPYVVDQAAALALIGPDLPGLRWSIRADIEAVARLVVVRTQPVD